MVDLMVSKAKTGAAEATNANNHLFIFQVFAYICEELDAMSYDDDKDER